MERIAKFFRDVFLHGDNPFVGNYRENALRPPGAVDEKRFMALCIRCNRCIEVCPYGSIKRVGFGPTLGTPYVFPEKKACYLCMACCRLCPTGALDALLRAPERVAMGKARIDPSICYSHLFLDHDVLPDHAGKKIGALCNTCYNVCPLPDTAITLKDGLFPVVLEGCVGCGVCVERCPVVPRRAINVVPAGMGRVDEAGFYFRKARTNFDTAVSAPKEGPGRVLKGRELLDRKDQIPGAKGQPAFEFPYEVPKKIDGWE